MAWLRNIRLRRLRWIAIAALVAGLLLLMQSPGEPYPGISTFRLVKEGMTRLEVERIVGGLPGFYEDGGPRKLPAKTARDAEKQDVSRFASWYAYEAHMKILFDDEDKVQILSVVEYTPGRSRSFLGKLKRWIGL